ncbi:7525_t:CDS:10 [Funneliformis geosporum]|uniref:E2 ubiquitin-conjugating enzyme n=1 Tax=Funneliformis geosporum TaxID=1117311 RepID=A0A9W4WRT8_9GLOM|nr:7525_t:CDS:10 [Funneliformis geosporum]CAI2174166.1 7672_t:CDS:10 [Funneliformis geosporum]
MSSSQLLPRMKRELEILECDPPPGIVCYPIDDSLLHFCSQIKGPKDTPYEDGLFKVDVQIPSRYPMEPPKMQFITPIYHPNVDDAGRICLDILKMPPNGSWKPSLNISTTLTSLSVLMADPNPDDPLLVEIASEFKENKSLFIQKARQATLKHAMEDNKSLNTEDLIQKPEQASSSTPAVGMPTSSSSSSQPHIEKKVIVQKAAQEATSDNLNETEERNFPTVTHKKKILSLSKVNSKIEKKKPLERISTQLKSDPTVSTSIMIPALPLTSSKSLQEEKVERVEKRRPFGDITKRSINVPANIQATTNQTQVSANNLNKAERKRNLLRKKPNDVATAESGVIESIELVNFMCHKFLKVPFGPKINFIIGHNGSGKSAILTGITVCLGGKANVTNRASNLKSLIREGSNVAQITIKLRNRGEDAFKHDIYGDSIIIERRISCDGSNRYKIKTHDGKRTVSDKREELNAILDHMAIQVDNPMNVLSQDTARQFLHSSSPEDKYKGTQLTQLSEDYELIRESIDTTQNIIKYKKEVIPELLKEAREAEARYKDMQKARELELTVASLKNQMAWAQVEEKEQEVAEAERVSQRAMKRLPNLQAEFDEINTIVLDLEQKYHDLTNLSINPLKERKNELNSLIRDKTRQLNELKACLKQDVEKHQHRIDEETQKLKDVNRQKRNDIMNAIRTAEEQLETLVEEQKQCRSQLTELEEKSVHIRNQKLSWEGDLRRNQEDIARNENLLHQLREQKSNNLKIFGPTIPDVLNAISIEKRWNKIPVGPFGLYMKLLKPDWSDILESVIGNTLSTFAVNNHRDQRLLSDILKRFNCNSPIIIGEDDDFDYTHGEPDRRFLTILRALQITDNNVKRRLINNNRIESIILVEKRAEADMIMHNNGRGFPHNVEGCYTIDGYKVGHKGGGFSTQSINRYRGPARFKQDIDGQIRDAERKLSDSKETNRRYKVELERAECELNKRKIQEDHRKAKELNNLILQLKEDLQQDEPANIAALEEVKKETEREIEMYKRQYANIQRKRLQLTDEHEPLVSEFEDIQQRLDALSSEAEGLGANIEENVRTRVKSEMNKKHWENKLTLEKENIATASSEVEKKNQVLEEWTRLARDYCPERVEVTKPAHELDREIKQFQARLREREKKHGASLEDIASAMSATCDAYRNAKQEVEHMEIFVKDLKSALQDRMSKWRNFRTFIAVRARIQFSYQLSKRGYSGKLMFDHPNKKLSLRVQINDQIGHGSDKDPKSLSGGEKSFSTICLLLALWEAMGCPIRCLDEFDVFMDAVNRRISMRMMIETAREADCTQYILITPQDASSVSPGPDVRVHRLQDPERGQATLNVPCDD